MATIYGTTSNQYITSVIEWDYTQDIDGNTSTVTATLYYRKNNTSKTYGTGTFSISIDGKKTTESVYIEITDDGWAKAISAKQTISHNSDGAKSITISASGSISGTTLQSTSCSGEVKLAIIPRASTIASATDKKLGSACSVKWTPLSKSFRYKLKFTLGGWTYTTDPIHPNTTSPYTYTDYTLPLTVANQLPSAKTGTMKVVLTTYSDSEAKTQIGSSSSTTFTVTVPDNESTKPEVTMTLVPVHFKSLGTAFNSVYIQGKSKVQATLSATGKYNADIDESSYKMSALGKTDTSSPYQSDYLPDSGLVTIKGYATDSRGYTGSTPKDITVIPYSKPQIIPASEESAVVCARCDSNGNLSEQGTSLKIKAKRSYSTVKDSDNKQLNFCLIRYRYKLESEESYSSWVTILDRSLVASDEVKTNALLSGQLSLTNTYMVQVGVIDDIGETNTVTITIPTEKVYMDRDGKNNALAIGKYAEDPNTLDIAEDWNIRVRGGLEVGGSSSVTSLKLGVEIPATATTPINLDTYKTPGNYYSAGADVSANITNSPYTEGGFGLVVRELQSTNYIGQEMHYARTRWVRHWNGSEWSGWVRNLITDTESGICTDYVVDQGTSGIWSYRKWASGHAECWGSTSVTRTFVNAWGTLYVCSPTTAITYPFAFVERPNEIATARTSSPACWLYADSSGKGLNTTTQSGIYAAARPTTVTSECTLYIDLIVKGRWK